MDEQYDVIIVGGRPAGASLAARLGARGARALVIDKATFPSAPGVPSCPIIYPAGMKLLSEMGIAEEAFSRGSVKIRDLSLEMGTWFSASFAMIEAHGRDYIYSIDRAPFDHALWENVARYPSVTRREGVAFVDLLRDGEGRVIGVEVESAEGEKARIGARVVVGADGRFSAVGRKVGARITEDCDLTSSVYFADWEGVAEHRGPSGRGIVIYATVRGLDVLFFPVGERRTTVAIHARSDRVNIEGDAERYYLDTLRAIPAARARIEGAKMATPLLGVKRVANRYYDHGGPGWALVGDALHQKDPVDGQGIYDALMESKLLDEAIGDFLADKKSWGEAIAWYGRRVREETHPMFLATMDRLRRELYDDPPEIVIRTLLRWLVTDPEYQRRFLLFLSRAIPAEGWMPPSLFPKVAARGLIRDLRGLVTRRDRPAPSGSAGH